MAIYLFTYKDFGMLYFVVGTGKIRMEKEQEKARKKYKEVSSLRSREKGIVTLGGFS